MSARKQFPPPPGADALRATLAGRLNKSTEEAPPASQEPAQPRTAANPPKPVPAPVAAPPPGMSKARLQRHVAALDNAFGKAAAALADYEDSMEDLAVLVADVRRVGLPEHLIVAAAARKNMEIPQQP